MYGNRYEKKSTPTGVLAILLIIFCIIGYFLSGLFKVPNLTLENVEDGILFVFTHPFSNWNDKSIACIGVGFIVWGIIVSYILTYYRNFHLDIEHGSADWLDPTIACKELKDKEPKNNRILTQNLQISLESGLSNNNALVVGSSGSFKTTSFMHQNLLQLGSCYVVLDVKGDTQRKLGSYLIQQGYTLKSLNFKIPEKSDRYNPFVYIEKEDDLLRAVKALHDACRPPTKSTSGDPFWDDGLNLYLQSLFYYAWLDGREKGIPGTMNDVLYLANLENKKIAVPGQEEEISCLQKLMDEKAKKYGDDYPPVRDYRKLKEGAEETVRSIIIMVNAMLAICETAEVKRIFAGNDIDIRELGTGVDGDPEKKIVLFLVIPDNNNVYNPFVSMFYTQMFDILIRLSDDELKKPLPVRVEVHMDEFYAGAKPADPDVLLGVVRSRNISMIPYLQSISQIKTLFRDDKWETIMDNVAAVVYLGSGPLAESTHKYISEALGKATIDSKGDNLNRGHNGSSGLNFSRMGRELMTPDEVKRMPSTEAIVFLESRPPIYDTKAIPFDKSSLGFQAPTFLKERYTMALSQAEYEHPVYAIYDAEHFKYITIDREEPLKILTDPKEIETYRKAAQKNPHIFEYTVDEKELLYLNWEKKKHTTEDVEKLLKQALEEEKLNANNIQGLFVLQNVPEEKRSDILSGNSPKDKSSWYIQDSFQSMIASYWDDLSREEQEEICLAMDQGLNEKQLSHMLLLGLEEMSLWRRTHFLENQKEENTKKNE